ncbi:MAG: TauD/TfdA family dioxygenase [Wenzhouxiangellaceae bacterium]
MEVLFGEKLIDYSYRSTPRTELRGRVYTATEYHPSEIIPQHNENSYTNKWAMRIGFFCLLPAVEGGETPIADSRLVYQNIDPAIREEFVQRKIMYVRNYGDIDLPWQEVFQSDDKNRVEEYCTANDIQFEWLDDGGLRTRQIRPAIAKHPRTGEPVWFNQAHLFHVSNLDPAVQESLLAVTDESGLPRNTYFADGGAIPTAMLDHIRQVYDARQMVFPWKAQDVLLLDNMLFSHGRKAFDGQRKVLVGMACPYLPPQQSEG